MLSQNLTSMKGKTIGDTPAWSIQENAYSEIFIFNNVRKPRKTDEELLQCQEYLEGKRADYPARQRELEKWKESVKERRQIMTDEGEMRASVLSNTPFDKYLHLAPGDDVTDLLTLPKEQQDALNEVITDILKDPHSVRSNNEYHQMICTARWACGSCRVVHSWKRIRNDEVIFVSQIINRSRTCLSEGNGIFFYCQHGGFI